MTDNPIKKRVVRIRHLARRLFDHIFFRVWLVEVFVFLISILCFMHLWHAADFYEIAPAQFLSFAWALLPVLAITNALPTLGAGAFLARFNVAEKPSEILTELNVCVQSRFPALGHHPRYNPYARQRYYIRALRKSGVKQLVFKEESEHYYVPRPNWDGIWYFGKDNLTDINIRRVHEMVYCAVIMLRSVLKVRDERVAFVCDDRGWTQGYKWFVEDLIKNRKIINKKIDIFSLQEALIIVILAVNSEHYMQEELMEHCGRGSISEHIETKFIEIFSDYVVWQSFFHEKVTLFWSTKYSNLNNKARLQAVSGWSASVIEKIYSGRPALERVQAKNRPRLTVAKRVFQVRMGALLPLIATASVLMLYTVLLIVAHSDAMSINFPELFGVAYALAAASIVVNFVFGIWLLLPTITVEDIPDIH